MQLAVFDFDGTLYRGDSFVDFGIRCRGRGRFAWAMVRSLPWLVGWKLGLNANSAAKERLFGNIYRGMPAAEFGRHCRDFAPIVEARLIEGTVDALRRHVDRGDRVVILSASPADWIRPWAESHGVREVIGTGVEIDRDGLLTGRFSTPNCHGDAKVRRLREAIPDLEAYEIWSYADSPSDASVMALAAHPVWV